MTLAPDECLVEVGSETVRALGESKGWGPPPSSPSGSVTLAPD